jgi:hypothetical protein
MNKAFPTDDKCREFLARLRWPNGPRCTRCGEPVVELETEKILFYCKACDFQFSVTAGSIFEIVPGLVESNGSRLLARYATCAC